MGHGNRTHERQCIVDRRVRPAGELMRFVLGPDGTVVADLKQSLPGRGVWVTADRAHVEAAVGKNLFPRAFKAPAKADAGLADQIADLLKKRVLAALSFANKAGAVVTGFDKIAANLRKIAPAVILHAREAAADGRDKLDRKAAKWGADAPQIINHFDGTQLDLALGRSNVVHAALMTGPASKNMLARYDAFVRFLPSDPSVCDLGMTKTHSVESTADIRSVERVFE